MILTMQITSDDISNLDTSTLVVKNRQGIYTKTSDFYVLFV